MFEMSVSLLSSYEINFTRMEGPWEYKSATEFVEHEIFQGVDHEL